MAGVLEGPSKGKLVAARFLGCLASLPWIAIPGAGGRWAGVCAFAVLCLWWRVLGGMAQPLPRAGGGFFG